MNYCETCHKKTTVPPPTDWTVVILASKDASAVFCPEHEQDRLTWLEKHGVGVQTLMLPRTSFDGQEGGRP